MNKRIQIRHAVSTVCAYAALTLLPAGGVLANDDNQSSEDEGSQSQIRRGYEINPVTLNLAGKNRALVGLGSYIVTRADATIAIRIPRTFRATILSLGSQN